MKRRSDRIKTCLLWAVAFGLLVTMWPVAGFTRDATAQQDRWAKYQIILERNIFSRQRGAMRRRDRDEEPRPVVVPNPESYFRLRGITQENSAFIAFLEDTRTGGVLRLRQGDRVARGEIKALDLDAIEYAVEGRASTVRVGQDLEGGQGAVTMTELLELSETSTAAGEEQSAGQEPIPAGDEADILKRLMEQRRQQLGQ